MQSKFTDKIVFDNTKILGKIKIYVLVRAELLFPLCYEIPCRKYELELKIFEDQ